MLLTAGSWSQPANVSPRSEPDSATTLHYFVILCPTASSLSMQSRPANTTLFLLLVAEGLPTTIFLLCMDLLDFDLEGDFFVGSLGGLVIWDCKRLVIFFLLPYWRLGDFFSIFARNLQCSRIYLRT